MSYTAHFSHGPRDGVKLEIPEAGAEHYFPVLDHPTFGYYSMDETTVIAHSRDVYRLVSTAGRCAFYDYVGRR